MKEQPYAAAELADQGTFEVHRDDLRSRDPLRYPGYQDALTGATQKAGTDESVSTGRARIGDVEVELASFSFSFMGGSMGEVAGERLARAMERAAQRAVPFVLRTATGGARMQEGMRSLIQMPKVVAARMTLAEAHQPFLAVLGHPTTGGVFASLASLADVTVAEEHATIGFAGPRVAERVTGRPLPSGSHTAASALNNGIVDDVVATDSVVTWVANALRCLAPDDPAPAPPAPADPPAGEKRDPWEVVQQARQNKDALSSKFHQFFNSKVELMGDRAGNAARDLDSSLVRLDGRRFLLLDTRGKPLWPSTFTKALRCIEVAARLQVPIVSFVDTPGADPSASSEQQGVARLIARLSEAMLRVPVPVLCVVTGEGGSGGALAFATGDAVIAFETSVFSVIGPEGAAEILWKDAARAPEAARSLKLTAPDLKDLGVADQVVSGEPTATLLRQVVTYHLDRMPFRNGLSQRRRQRWRDTW